MAPCTSLCTFTTFYVSLQCHLLYVLLVSKYWVIVNLMHGRTRKEYGAELMPHDAAASPFVDSGVGDLILM